MPTNNTPYQFNYETITASQATSEANSGLVDFLQNPNDAVIKLTLNVDIARVSNADITSITGATIDLVLDSSQFEPFQYVAGDATLTYYYLDAKSTTANGVEIYDVSPSEESTEANSGLVSKIIIGSNNAGLIMVDNIPADAFGQDAAPSSQDIMTIYLIPKSTVDVNDINISYTATVAVNQSDDSLKFTQEVQYAYGSAPVTNTAPVAVGTMSDMTIELGESCVSVSLDNGLSCTVPSSTSM